MIKKIAICAAVFVVVAVVLSSIVMGVAWVGGAEIERGRDAQFSCIFGLIFGGVATGWMSALLLKGGKEWL